MLFSLAHAVVAATCAGLGRFGGYQCQRVQGGHSGVLTVELAERLNGHGDIGHHQRSIRPHSFRRAQSKTLHYKQRLTRIQNRLERRYLLRQINISIQCQDISESYGKPQSFQEIFANTVDAIFI